MSRAAPKIPFSQPGRSVRGALFALAIGFSTATATAGDLIVRYDQSQLLRLPRPATQIIVGNPSIADVSLQDGNLLVVTGKTFGITNIIVLDFERNVIQDQRVMVERDDNKVVNLQKGSRRFTYACTPNCEPTSNDRRRPELLRFRTVRQLEQDEILGRHDRLGRREQ